MISIIIPLYNRGKIIHKTLDSILGLSYQDFEVIVVDDGSQDDSLEISRKYQDKFWERKIRYKVIGQENRGAPAARNRGFEESRGDYLFFCDADATLKSNVLEILLKTLESKSLQGDLDSFEIGYAYSNFLWGNKLFRIGEFSEEKLKSGPMIHTMSLIKRELFPKKGWDESIKKLQDWDLYLTMLENNKKGVWVDKVLFKIETGGTISSWLPSFAYKLFPFLPSVKKYKKAVEIIKNKHDLK